MPVKTDPLLFDATFQLPPFLTQTHLTVGPSRHKLSKCTIFQPFFSFDTHGIMPVFLLKSCVYALAINFVLIVQNHVAKYISANFINLITMICLTIKLMFFETNVFHNLNNRLKINRYVEKYYSRMVALI